MGRGADAAQRAWSVHQPAFFATTPRGLLRAGRQAEAKTHLLALVSSQEQPREHCALSVVRTLLALSNDVSFSIAPRWRPEVQHHLISSATISASLPQQAIAQGAADAGVQYTSRGRDALKTYLLQTSR